MPANIDRFTKVFNGYGRASGTPYVFKFTVRGDKVTVDFKRDIKTVPEAIRELTSRYGGASDRDGWMEAIATYHKLESAKGTAAIQAVDMANNLEHTHGAMMEHFPPGVQQWYPKFLDFKYTGHVIQLARAISSRDLRVLAMELLPGTERMHRLVTPKTDHRTPKGLALEISSQRGKPAKKKMVLEVKEKFPDLYPKVVENLLEKGLGSLVPPEDLPKIVDRVAARFIRRVTNRERVS